MQMYSAKDIIRLLNENIELVVPYLLANGKRKGNEWYVGSVNGEAGNSLKVCMNGSKIGLWRDFAGNEGGDLLNLWCSCRNKTISEAILEIRQWLGIPSPTFEPPQRTRWVKPEIKNEVPIKPNSRVYNYLVGERKLTPETLNKFQIKETQSEIAFPYYRDGKLTLIKYLKVDRPNGKKEIRVTPNSEPCLFGWDAIPKGARTGALLEGELDAMSMVQYDLDDIAFLSVPFGGGTGGKHQWLENEFDRLSIFDEIFLCLDNDAVGQAATKELSERLGRHRCRIVRLPYKDANECLQKGVTKEEIQKCFDNAQSLDPDELKSASQYVNQVIEAFYPPENQFTGYELPWQKAHGKISFRSGELSSWTGINGHGKSQFLGQLLLHCMLQGARICIASLELKPRQLLKNLTRQASGLRHPTNEYIKAIHEWYHQRLWMFDLVGTAKTKRLLEVFQYARQRYGIDVFVIDSFMKCGIGEEDLNAQKLFVEQLCDFKNTHDCHIHLVVHPRKGTDETKAPGKLDIKGSGSISDLADNCYTIWRNKKKEDEIRKLNNTALPDSLLDKPDCILLCDKQRNGEWEGKLFFWFNHDALQYLENRYLKPLYMVEWSNQSNR